MFSLLINAVILLLNCFVLILHLFIHYLSLRHYFLYWLGLYITDSAEFCTDTVLLYVMVLKYFPRLWGTGISDAIFYKAMAFTFKVLALVVLSYISFKKKILEIKMSQMWDHIYFRSQNTRYVV